MQRADKRHYHYIYKITRDDGRYYIGMHSTDNLEDGYFGSGKLITASIRKHGLKRHNKEIIEFLDSREELKKREAEIITEEIVNDKLCMNLKLGGSGGWDHWNRPDNYAVKYAQGLHGLDAAKEKLHYLYEHDSDFVMMRKEQCVLAGKQAHAVLRQKYPDGIWKGKKHNAGTKAKISKASSMHQSGIGNSQYGTCWMTDGVSNMKIKKEQLDTYLNMGYTQGRICKNYEACS